MVLLRRVRELYCALRFDNTIKNAPNKHQCHQQSTKALNRGHFDFKLGLWGLSTILRRIKQASSRPVWHFSCNNLIPCLHWFLPKSLLWNLQYSGMFSVTVESHCNAFKTKFFQCDSTLVMLLRTFPNTVNFIAVIWVKTNVNRGLNFCS